MVLLNKPFFFFFFLFFLTVLIANVYADDDLCGDGQIDECIICLCGCKDKHKFKKFLCDLQCGIICGCDEPEGCAA
ncbi:hypothetical protein C1646_683817 [Rhizophagus diaphanus]|nr:hypothetical protein C1646_683817 [Rhizophagus diaphanus] [Rhizophagus sp. MUCL 43196]